MFCPFDVAVAGSGRVLKKDEAVRILHSIPALSIKGVFDAKMFVP